MSLQSTAQQELIVVDPSMGGGGGMSLIPLEIEDMLEVPEEHSHEEHEGHEHHERQEHQDGPEHGMEVMELSNDLEVSDLPGAPPGTKDPEPEPEPVLEVSEDRSKIDDNEAKKSKKDPKWDWESRGPHGFVDWVTERYHDTPKHSGYDTAGVERAIAYLEKLDSEVSKAMRLDLNGELDANKIEKVRAMIDNGIERLHSRLDAVKSSKKKSRKKKSELVSDGLVKEAQKITGVQGVFVTVPLLISRIARVCINGMVSAGHDIEDLYARQVKFYKLSDREQAEVMQLLFDMGYPMRQDRGFMPDQEFDPGSSDNMDYAANYRG